MDQLTPLESQLIEQIIRAKVAIEALGLGKLHDQTCPAEMGGKCTCGADEHNSKVDRALSYLEIGKK